MKIRRLYLAAAAMLAFGVWLLANYCQGSAGLQAGDSIAAFSIKLDLTTTGYPVLFGVPTVLLGSFLLLVCWIASLVIESRGVFSRGSQSRKKLEGVEPVQEPRPPL